MRSQVWLENRLEYLYRRFFYDVDAPNQIEIRWGRKAKNQLGCIRREGKKNYLLKNNKNLKTIITVNGFLRDKSIPEYVIDSVIVHELAHYAHGFNSPLPQIYNYPHKHGVVKSELESRGLLELEKAQKNWLKNNWLRYLHSQQKS